MNRCDYLDPALAWTGVKDTGRGATLSRLGYEQLTRPKCFHLRQLSLTATMSLTAQLELPHRRPLRRRPHQRTGRGLPAAGHRSGRCWSPIPASPARR